MFQPVVRLALRIPTTVLLLALLLAAGATWYGDGVSSKLSTGGTSDPAAEASRAADLVQATFPERRPNLVLVVGAPGGVTAPGSVADGRALTARLTGAPGVSAVLSFWTNQPALRTEDGTLALITAQVAGDDVQAARTLAGLADRLTHDTGSLRVRLAGPLEVQRELQKVTKEDLTRAELIALPLTLLVLLLTFGSLVSAALPLLVGAISMVSGNAVLMALTRVTDVSVYAQNLTTALSLGLAIDYSLLIVRRFREELATGSNPRAAVQRTMATAGRAVGFSAVTLMVALMSMLAFPMYFLRSFGYAGLGVVAVAALIALLALPAALLLLGRRVDALSVRRRRAITEPTSPTEPTGTEPTGTEPTGTEPTGTEPTGTEPTGTGPTGFWARYGRLVVRRPGLVAAAGVGLLLVLSAPVAHASFATADERQLPAASEARQAQQDVRTRFGTTSGEQIDVLLDGTPSATGLDDYASRLSRLDGVAAVSAPSGAYLGGRRVAPADAAAGAAVRGGRELLTVVARGSANTSANRDLVRALRRESAPVDALVGGTTAAQLDVEGSLLRQLPIALSVIVLSTLILMFLLSGSVVIPVLTVALGVLSLSVMFGVSVWVFQDGHLATALGFTPTGTIPTTLPVLMFCIAFGLSMDYAVFLVSRIAEERRRTDDPRDAVVLGVARIGGLITSAAFILAVVLVSIGTSRITNIKMLGLGLALGVLVDTFVVRCTVVSALLAVLGRWAWWAPAPLQRLQRRWDPAVDGRPRTTSDDSPKVSRQPAVPRGR